VQQTFKGVGNMSNFLEYFFNVEDAIEVRLQDLVANDGSG